MGILLKDFNDAYTPGNARQAFRRVILLMEIQLQLQATKWGVINKVDNGTGF